MRLSAISSRPPSELLLYAYGLGVALHLLLVTLCLLGRPVPTPSGATEWMARHVGAISKTVQDLRQVDNPRMHSAVVAREKWLETLYAVTIFYWGIGEMAVVAAGIVIYARQPGYAIRVATLARSFREDFATRVTLIVAMLGIVLLGASELHEVLDYGVGFGTARAKRQLISGNAGCYLFTFQLWGSSLIVFLSGLFLHTCIAALWRNRSLKRY